MNENSSHDILLPHENLSSMPDDIVLKLLKTMFPDHELYSLSVDWRKDKRYILKARGVKGDIIVGWLENKSDGQKTVKHCPIL